MYKQLMIALFGFSCVGLTAQESDVSENNGTEQTANDAQDQGQDQNQGQEVAAQDNVDSSNENNAE